jgi:hypothetical protein
MPKVLVGGIKRLNKNDRKALLLFFSGKDIEMKRRLGEIETGKVKPLTREAILKDAL